ncbi:hypothetical protein Nepgr_021735 [Nepenthes gracilis]|uniref:Uncharacterized protein n=1 Tax=Nepenthes gracilis TaxID=150966 RepID=A0AAD3SZS4_NEPGR|nr:hypothetical protein Nepgr_021735 [Nepenthes gracilis]
MGFSLIFHKTYMFTGVLELNLSLVAATAAIAVAVVLCCVGSQFLVWFLGCRAAEFVADLHFVMLFSVSIEGGRNHRASSLPSSE